MLTIDELHSENTQLKQDYNNLQFLLGVLLPGTVGGSGSTAQQGLQVSLSGYNMPPAVTNTQQVNLFNLHAPSTL